MNKFLTCIFLLFLFTPLFCGGEISTFEALNKTAGADIVLSKILEDKKLAQQNQGKSAKKKVVKAGEKLVLQGLNLPQSFYLELSKNQSFYADEANLPVRFLGAGKSFFVSAQEEGYYVKFSAGIIGGAGAVSDSQPPVEITFILHKKESKQYYNIHFLLVDITTKTMSREGKLLIDKKTEPVGFIYTEVSEENGNILLRSLKRHAKARTI